MYTLIAYKPSSGSYDDGFNHSDAIFQQWEDLGNFMGCLDAVFLENLQPTYGELFRIRVMEEGKIVFDSDFDFPSTPHYIIDSKERMWHIRQEETVREVAESMKTMEKKKEQERQQDLETYQALQKKLGL